MVIVGLYITHHMVCVTINYCNPLQMSSGRSIRFHNFLGKTGVGRLSSSLKIPRVFPSAGLILSMYVPYR